MWERVVSVWNYPLMSLGDGDVLAVKQLVLVALVVVLGIAAIRLAQRVIRRRLATTQIQADAALAIERVLFYTMLVLLVMTALSLLRVPLTAFAFASGAVAIGVGFGAQNIINNFISGWILMSERPVKIGDFVEIESSMGTVEEIGNRSTRIRRTDGVHLLVPNSLILEQTVVNWTLVDRQIRSVVRIGVAYGSPVHQVAELIRRAVEEQPLVKKTPAPIVVFEDFGDSALIFDAFFWCDVSAERELRLVRSDVRFRITDLFAEHGIVIAFPQRDVHIDAQAPVPVRVVNAAEGAGDAS